jgi:hypothetical protein
VWAWDFAFDHTTSGSQLKWLSIVDEHTRECLALKVDRSITSEDVIDHLKGGWNAAFSRRWRRPSWRRR